VKSRPRRPSELDPSEPSPGRCGNGYHGHVRRITVLLALASTAACFAESADDRVTKPADTRAAELPIPAEPTVGSARGEQAGEHEDDSPLLATSFEPASPSCNGWSDDDGSAIRSIPARSGAYACKLCSGEAGPRTLELSNTSATVEPGRYVLTAWVRSRPITAAPETVSAVLETVSPFGVAEARSVAAVGDTWSPLEVALDVSSRASPLRVTIRALAEAGECILVDDVRLERAR
jgi:hypothetical protein